MNEIIPIVISGILGGAVRACFGIYKAKKEATPEKPFVLDAGLLASSLVISGVVGTFGGLYAPNLNDIIAQFIGVDLQLTAGPFSALAFGFMGIDIIEGVLDRLPLEKK